MKHLLLLASLVVSVMAQAPAPGVVACKLSIESSQTMKALYGGRVPLYSGNVVCKNYSLLTVGPIGSPDLYLALGTVNTMTASDATALLSKVYGRSTAAQMGQAVQSANTGMSLLAGLKQLSISASSLGYIGFGVGVFSQAILPFFTAGQPNLNTLLANQCDGLQSVSLAPGQSISCTIYIQKPAKGVALPGAVAFDLVPTGPTAPGPLPPVAPVQLRPRTVSYAVEPEARIHPDVGNISPEMGINHSEDVAIDSHRLEAIMTARRMALSAGITTDFKQPVPTVVEQKSSTPSAPTMEDVWALQRQLTEIQLQLERLSSTLRIERASQH